jgi:DNA-binding MarR family transcriptional regulator
VPKRWDRDPILEAYDLWLTNGWDGTADGMTAVTSLLRVNQLVGQRADAILTDLELSFARYEVLVVLYFNEDAVPLSYVARALQLHQASVTSLVDKLEKQGLLERRAHPTDRRSTLAQITRTGKTRTRTAMDRLNAELYSGLGLETDEAKLLITLLTKMRRAWGDYTGDDSTVDNPGGDDAGSTHLHVAQSSA